MNAKLALLGGVAVVGLAVAFSSYFTVDQYERGVVTTAGRFSYIADPGLHFKVPFYQGVQRYRIDVQQFTTPKLNSYTVDNQEVDATLTVQYQLPINSLEFIYANTPVPEAPLQSMVIDRFKIEAGKINVTDFANNRGALVDRVRGLVRDEAERLYHIKVTDLQLPNLDYQESFRVAQAQAAVVKTQIEQAQGLKLKADIEAETAKVKAAGEANAAIEAARGRAQSMRLEAEQQANAILVKGQAQAQAQQLMADALAKNASLVEYEKAMRWNGVLPQNIYASAPVPFLNMSK